MVSVAEGGEKRPDNEFIAVSKKKKSVEVDQACR